MEFSRPTKEEIAEAKAAARARDKAARARDKEEQQVLIAATVQLAETVSRLTPSESLSSDIALSVLGLAETLDGKEGDWVASLADEWPEMSEADRERAIGGGTIHDPRFWHLQAEFLRRYGPRIEGVIHEHLEAGGCWSLRLGERIVRMNPDLPRDCVHTTAYHCCRVLDHTGWPSVEPLLDLGRWAIAGFLYFLVRAETEAEDQVCFGDSPSRVRQEQVM